MCAVSIPEVIIGDPHKKEPVEMDGLPRTRRKLVRKGVSTLGDYWYLMGGNITVQVLSMFMYMYVAYSIFKSSSTNE